MKPVNDNLPKPKLQQWLTTFLNRRFTQPFYIGLEIGFSRINLVQMEYLAGKIHMRAIASIPFTCSRETLLSDPNALKALLKQAYAVQPFKGNKVVSCLPAEHVRILTISYNHVEGHSDDEAVVTELRERYKNELDHMVVDFMSLRQEDSNSGKRDALVALAPHDKVVAYLDLLSNAGLNVEALDIGPAALTRTVCHTGALLVPEYPSLPNVLLINFGAESSFLTIVWGRRLMLDRPIEFSENRMFTRLKQALDMPEELMINLLYEQGVHADKAQNQSDEANQMVTDILRPEINLLLQEINKTLVYMASKTRGKSVDQIYLTGRVSRYAGILNLLKAQLNVKVELLDPVEVFAADNTKLKSQNLGTMAGIALTTGLALRGVPERG